MRRALVLLALMVVPLAAADHVYTHRYTASGRVLGPDGAPLANVTVELEVDGASSLAGDCVARRGEVRSEVLKPANASRTNAYGDFEVCAHVHALSAASTARVRAADGPWRNLTVDLGTRISFVTLALAARPAEADDAAADWNRTLLLRARYWQPATQPLELDHVPALGEALAGRSVTVAVAGHSGAGTLRTDAYGDVALYVERPQESGDVTFSAALAQAPATAPFDAARLRAEAVLFAKAQDLAAGQTAPPAERESVPAPGALAAVTLAAFVAARRRRA